MKTRFIDYDHDGVDLQGYLATPSGDDPWPLVILSHTWAGRGNFENGYAEKTTSLGYAGFALDLYGKGVLGSSNEENEKLLDPFLKDRSLLRARLLKTIDTVKALPEVDASRVVFAGFCFGGLCAFDVARAGADVKGCASFHGLFNPPDWPIAKKIDARVIAFHGYDDPMATPDQLTAFGSEMTKADADWQVHAYGGVMHAFTNPAANSPDFGTVYNKAADDRAWRSFQAFLEECFE